MAAYYNEIDQHAAKWLRNLISAGHIAPGDVDTRSIVDVSADDLKPYTQCHFFAGIGVWSHALRLSGWSDDREVWTGSCPCQPFSVAGAGKGQSDERHLWPEFHRLIAARKPAVVFGEQVEAAIRHGWLDLVQADLEGSGYEFGAAGIPAAGVGAPHIRQRLWFVAERGVTMGDACGAGLEGLWSGHQAENGRNGAVRSVAEAGEFGGVADCAGSGSLPGALSGIRCREESARSRDVKSERLCDAIKLADTLPAGRAERRPESRNGSVAGSGCCGEHGNCGEFGIVEFAGSIGRNGRETAAPGNVNDWTASEWPQGEYGAGVAGAHRIHQYRTGPTNGFWRNADWLLCRDGKWRPVESTTERMADGIADSLGFVRTGEGSFGLSPLKQGAKSRVGRLKAYGNAIVPQVAQAFIESYMACRS